MPASIFSHFRSPLLLAALLGLAGCDLLEFSPNDTRVPDDVENLTQKNLNRLAARPAPAPGDTLRFAFTTDTQRYYDEIDPLIASLNQQQNLAFVLIGGDISDFGLSREMQWVAQKLNRLHVPYFTVIGNHDLVANGREAYQKVFGPLNYSFTYDSTRFILTDTNSREYNFNGRVPDVPWLQQQLADSLRVRRQVTVCHVPPVNDDFDPALVAGYTGALALAPKLVFNLSGHVDKFGVAQPYNDQVTYISGYSVAQRNYLVLSIWGKREYRFESVAY